MASVGGWELVLVSIMLLSIVLLVALVGCGTWLAVRALDRRQRRRT